MFNPPQVNIKLINLHKNVGGEHASAGSREFSIWLKMLLYVTYLILHLVNLFIYIYVFVLPFLVCDMFSILIQSLILCLPPLSYVRLPKNSKRIVLHFFKKALWILVDFFFFFYILAFHFIQVEYYKLNTKIKTLLEIEMCIDKTSKQRRTNKQTTKMKLTEKKKKKKKEKKEKQ